MSIIASPAAGVVASVENRGDTVMLRLEWKNYRVRRDNFLVIFYFLFWLAWASASVWVTYCILAGRVQDNLGPDDLPSWIGWSCLGVWLFGAWVVAFYIPYLFVTLSWLEWVEISTTSVGGCTSVVPGSLWERW